MTFKQMFQLIQLRLLYKLAKIPNETRKSTKRLTGLFLKMFTVLVLVLHY